jgi:3-oxoacyl-[acyl-carrier protein] reductase
MTPDADWDMVQDTNLGGAFRCSRAVLPGMVAQRHGAIVNISSLAGVSGFAGQSAYAASKAALIGMSKSLAREMAKRRIRVNVVVPGYVATDMTADLTESVSRELRDLECLPDGTTPEDVAAVVAFLLSDRAKAVTGQALAVDAGSSA